MQRKSTREIYVVKLSGSLFFSSQFENVVKILIGTVRKNKSMVLVLIAGGGPTARRYIQAGKKFDADESSLDEIGIAISRLNAGVLKEALGNSAFSSVPENLSEIVDALEIGAGRRDQLIIVCGGLYPGQSTNAVAALIAEKARAVQLINATDVDGVYNKDPRKFSRAKKLRSVSIKKLAEMLTEESVQAGDYDLMDPVALKIIARSKIPTQILKCDPKILEAALAGKLHGTKITF
ncbi:MAG: UMP kinase [Nitrososphaerales archaeon]